MANPALTDGAVSPGAVAWVLTSTALVFLMTAGLSLFFENAVGAECFDSRSIWVRGLGLVCLAGLWTRLCSDGTYLVTVAAGRWPRHIRELYRVVEPVRRQVLDSSMAAWSATQT